MAQPGREDKGSHVVAAAACAIVIQMIMLVLRFWSRALSTRTRFWWDDWMVLAALVRLYSSSEGCREGLL